LGVIEINTDNEKINFFSNRIFNILILRSEPLFHSLMKTLLKDLF